MNQNTNIPVESKPITKGIPIEIILEEGAFMPEYKTAGAAGMDLKALESVKLQPFTPTLVKTGIRIAIPEDYEGQVRPRSGLALKGVTVHNSPGTIDFDYRGDVGVILMYIPPPNSDTGLLGKALPFEINRGDRIAQLVIAKVTTARLVPVLLLDETERGEGGFGSTGK